MSANKVVLISGIPRSGTTLTCKLLNSRDDCIALHEPINPSSAFTKDMCADTAAGIVVDKIHQLERDVSSGNAFEHGDANGLEVSNPVGETVQHGLRQVRSRRGQTRLDKRPERGYTLFIKQNALFAALASPLFHRFETLLIVRNPVDVLLSWFTVNLPVNKGHVPAGERFSATLRNQLAGKSQLQRQIAIYQWFIDVFSENASSIVRYEDIVTTGGEVLDKQLQLFKIDRPILSPPKRSFERSVIEQLRKAVPLLITLDFKGLYNQVDVEEALFLHGVE